MIKILYSLSLNSVLYTIILFLTIWDTLQIDKPPIPLFQALYYGALVILYIQKVPNLDFKRDSIRTLLCIILLYAIVYFVKGDNYDHCHAIYLFFRFYIVCIILQAASSKELYLAKVMFIALIVAHCLIALYERSIMTVLLWNSEDYSLGRNSISDLAEFRSSGFFGHPVLCGFILSVVLVFIQFSNFDEKKKYAISILVLFALLAHNSRANIIISVIVSLFIIFRKTLFNKRKRTFSIIIFVVTFGTMFYLLGNTEWGGRLYNTERHDVSLLARFEAFDTFSYLSFDQLLIGDWDLAEKVTMLMQASFVENGYIVILLKYGLIFGLPIIFLFTRYQWQLLDIYKKIDRLVILSVFIVIALTNPHLGHQIPWEYFFISFFLFKPSNDI